MDEQTLIQSILDGDHNAFRELVKKYESQVASTVIGMLGTGQEAEDIGQEAFVRFFRALKGFRGESSVGTYLTRIAINLSLNEIKRRGRRRQIFTYNGEEKIGALAHNPGTERRSEAAQLVAQGLRRLDPKYRTVLVLRLLDGYSTQETAAILRLPQGTVLSRLARAQKKLKDILAVHYQEVSPIRGERHE